MLSGREAHLLPRLHRLERPGARELAGEPRVRRLADADDRVALLTQQHVPPQAVRSGRKSAIALTNTSSCFVVQHSKTPSQYGSYDEITESP